MPQSRLKVETDRTVQYAAAMNETTRLNTREHLLNTGERLCL
ncbi:hypothetical protein BN439_2086 [Erwinia amylovora Ea644]|nr:hypothetical protein BN439_2086 [Erwinia amylovora Ea644]CCP07144.1 hypothetical protein BN440_2121 [Erwinia amylovora MR1]